MNEKNPVQVKISTEATLTGLLLTRAESHTGLAFEIHSPKESQKVFFSQWIQQIQALSMALLEKGFQKGKVFLLIGDLSLDLINLELAAMALGGIPLVLSQGLPVSLIQQIKEEVSPFGFVLSKEVYPVYRETLPRENCWFWEEEVQDLPIPYLGLFERDPERHSSLMGLLEMATLEIQSSDPAALVYSRGSETSSPRGVVLTHQNILWAIKSLLLSIPFYKEDTFAPLHLSLFNRLAGVFLPLFLGRPVYLWKGKNSLELLPRTSPHVIFSSSENFRDLTTSLEKRLNSRPVRSRIFEWGKKTSPFIENLLWKKPLKGLENLLAQLHRWFVLPRSKKILGKNLRLILSSGEKMAPSDIFVLQSLGVEVWEGYTLSEVPLAALNCCRHEKIQTQGRPVNGVEMAVGKGSELLISGPQVSPGYFGKDLSLSPNRDPAGRFKTGDRGELDEDGYLQLKGKVARE